MEAPIQAGMAHEMGLPLPLSSQSRTIISTQKGQLPVFTMYMVMCIHCIEYIVNKAGG